MELLATSTYFFKQILKSTLMLLLCYSQSYNKVLTHEIDKDFYFEGLNSLQKIIITVFSYIHTISFFISLKEDNSILVHIIDVDSLFFT